VGAFGYGTVFEITGADFVTPATELAALLAEVTGVGPGTSLADKVQLAQTYYSAKDIPNTCSTLTSFVNEVNAQNGKKDQPTAGWTIGLREVARAERGMRRCSAGDMADLANAQLLLAHLPRVAVPRLGPAVRAK
jgi:hypothetical protein